MSFYHGRERALSVIGCVAVALLSASALAQPIQLDAAELPAARADDGGRYPLMQLEVRYNEPHLPMPTISSILETAEVEFGVTDGGLTSARDGLPTVRVKLEQINDVAALPDRIFYRSAIQAISRALVAEFTQRGMPDVSVTPAPGQFSATGDDLRTAGNHTLVLVVNPGPDVVPIVDGMRYPVFELHADYTEVQPWLPSLEYIMNAPLTLGVTEGGLVAWREGLPAVRVKLNQFYMLPDRILFQSAVDAICETIEQEFQNFGYVGVDAHPAEGQFGEDGRDLRADANYPLKIVVESSGIRSSVSKVDRQDGGWYPVSTVRLVYQPERESLPAIEKVMQAKVRLGDTEGGLVAYREGLAMKEVSLSDLDQQEEVMLFGSAVRAMSRSIVEQMNDAGYIGVVIEPGEGQFGPDGEDMRPEGDQTLTLVVKPGIVTDVRTVARGDGGEEDINSYLHRRIRQGSPVQPTSQASGDEDILRKQALDRYVQWLNRHPGRRVDVAVAAGSDPGTFSVDYMVQQPKPWTVYGQVANTGTSQTSDWRERLGFVHHQLTGNDDILRVDYVTASFDTSHSLIGSYEAPLLSVDRVRWKAEGTYSEYTASDVGDFSDDYSGTSWSAGGGLSWNFFQQEDFFVDLVGGALWQEISVTRGLFGTETEPFFRPYVGVRGERIRPVDSFFANATVDLSADSIAGTDEMAASNLGRSPVDTDWALLRYDASYAFYVEPLLAGGEALTARAPEVGSLVHEIYLSARGQQTLDGARLIPQMQMTAGGLYTVRGYDESAAVGDDVVVLTAEYRFHLPRLFAPSEQAGELFGRPMHWRPANVYSRPDWDLVLRAFVDYARTSDNDAEPFEPDQELLGAGVGVELQVQRNLNLRVDWGHAFMEAIGSTPEGNDRIHVVGTVLY